MKKFIAILLSVLMLLTMLVACAEKPADEVKDNENQEDNVDDKPVVPEGWTEADATESLAFHTGTSFNSLDTWAESGNNTAGAAKWLIFDPVLRYDSEGNIEPWLAEEYKMADDYMSIEFKLREDVYFTNGEQMTADDVIFSFECIINDVEHHPESYASKWRSYIESMEKIDEFTFVMNFTQLMPRFWSQITDPGTCIISKKAYEEMGYDEFWKKPVGTGAYVVENWDGANCVLECTIRTDEHGYWGYDYANENTNVKNITFMYSPEVNTRIASLRTGEAQIVDSVAAMELPGLEADGYHAEALLASDETYLGLNCEGAFADAKLREAFSLCIDRELLVESILGGKGIAAEFPCNSTQYGYSAYSEDLTYKYDLEKAKQLVEESSYNGEELVFLYSAAIVAVGNELAPAIQSMASEAGINLTLRPVESAIFSDTHKAKDFDVLLANVGGGQINWIMMVGDLIGGDRMHTSPSQEIMDKAVQVKTNMDPELLEELYSEVYTIMMSEYQPMLLLYFPQNTNVWDSGIQNVQFHYSAVMDLHAVTIE